jgi:hypothetical protein
MRNGLEATAGAFEELAGWLREKKTAADEKLSGLAE